MNCLTLPLLTQDTHPEQQQSLCDTLNHALAELSFERYRIKPFELLNEAEKRAATVAIVANPDPAQLSELPMLVWIHSLWAGVEHLMSQLPLLPNPELKLVRLVDPQLSEVMAEAVLAWTYYLHREMPHYQQAQREKNWSPLAYTAAASRRVSVFGLGELGAAAALRLRDNGFQVSGWSRRLKSLDGVQCYSGREGLLACLAETDIAVCLLPLTPETRGLFNATTLAALPQGASVINFARGPIVDTSALLQALERQLAHAVLDVFDQEPLPRESVLWSHPKITVLPHISGPTDRHSAAKIVAQHLKCYHESGELPETVSRQDGY